MQALPQPRLYMQGCPTEVLAKKHKTPSCTLQVPSSNHTPVTPAPLTCDLRCHESQGSQGKLSLPPEVSPRQHSLDLMGGGELKIIRGLNPGCPQAHSTAQEEQA